MSTATVPCSAAASYPEVEGLAKWLVGKFRRRYGGDYDELISACHLAYCRAVHRFDPGKGVKFATYFSRAAVLNMKNVIRTELRKRRCRLSPTKFLCGIPDYRSQFDLNGLLENLSEDAATVLRLTLDLEGRGGRKGLRKALQGMGWAAARCREAIREVWEVLH